METHEAAPQVKSKVPSLEIGLNINWQLLSMHSKPPAHNPPRKSNNKRLFAVSKIFQSNLKMFYQHVAGSFFTWSSWFRWISQPHPTPLINTSWFQELHVSWCPFRASSRSVVSFSCCQIRAARPSVLSGLKANTALKRKGAAKATRLSLHKGGLTVSFQGQSSWPMGRFLRVILLNAESAQM